MVLYINTVKMMKKEDNNNENLQVKNLILLYFRINYIFR